MAKIACFRIPPTEVGGLFKSSLLTAKIACSESPRLKVGGSFKFSLLTAKIACSEPSDGSRGIVQVQPTDGEDCLFRTPPTEVGGSFKSSLLTAKIACSESPRLKSGEHPVLTG